MGKSKMKQFLRNRLVRLAFVVVMVYFIASLFGLREHVSILSGVDESEPKHLALGLIYLLSYSAFVILAPVLILSAILEFSMPFRHKPRIPLKQTTDQASVDESMTTT